MELRLEVPYEVTLGAEPAKQFMWIEATFLSQQFQHLLLLLLYHFKTTVDYQDSREYQINFISASFNQITVGFSNKTG